MANTMERAASKLTGKAKAAKARIKGLKGIFRTLAEEHGEVKALLERISMSSDASVRADLFPEVKKELLAHERGEVEVLYPVLRENPKTREIAQEHDKEARELESTLSSLDQQSYDSKQWEKTFDRLVDLVDHHTMEEENEYFPRAQEVLGEKRAKELETRYLAAKKSIMKEL